MSNVITVKTIIRMCAEVHGLNLAAIVYVFLDFKQTLFLKFCNIYVAKYRFAIRCT